MIMPGKQVNNYRVTGTQGNTRKLKHKKRQMADDKGPGEVMRETGIKCWSGSGGPGDWIQETDKQLGQGKMSGYILWAEGE